MPTIENSDIKDAIEDVSAKVTNADPGAADALRRFEPTISGDVPVTGADVLAAFVAGLHAGSVAAIRTWLRRSPATFLAYYSDRTKVIGKQEIVIRDTGERRDFLR